MLQRHRHIVIFLLLFSYLLLGIVGHLETLILSGFGTNPQVLMQSKDGPQRTTKVYWTQYKHIQSTVKISVPSLTIFTPPEFARTLMSSISFTQSTSGILFDLSVSLHSSRAPPQI